MKMSRWSNAATSFIVVARRMPLPTTPPGTSPTPAAGDSAWRRPGPPGLGRDRLPPAAGRQALRHIAAFGANRHDHRVLDLLRFHQSEDFGAKVLRPVRPADAAARDLAEAHMNGLETRRIDEDLVE